MCQPSSEPGQRGPLLPPSSGVWREGKKWEGGKRLTGQTDLRHFNKCQAVLWARTAGTRSSCVHDTPARNTSAWKAWVSPSSSYHAKDVSLDLYCTPKTQITCFTLNHLFVWMGKSETVATLKVLGTLFQIYDETFAHLQTKFHNFPSYFWYSILSWTADMVCMCCLLTKLNTPQTEKKETDDNQ